MPEHGSVTLLDSAEVPTTRAVALLANVVYGVAPVDNYQWPVADEGIVTKYDDSLKPVASAVFPLQDDRQTIGFMAADEYLLLLNEYNDGDSMGVVARRFDASTKLYGKPVRVAQSAIEGDGEEKPRSGYAMVLSPDSSVFCVWNTAYKEDGGGTTIQMDVFNKKLDIVQHRVIAVPDSAEVGNINVDNTGALAIVRMDTSGRMVCQRFVAGRDVEELELKVASAKAVKRRLESADVVCSNEKEWTVFSFICPDSSKNISSIVLHSCNWATGEARVLTEYEITEHIAKKIGGNASAAMKHFRIHDVLTTNRGFVVWSEAIADSMYRLFPTKNSAIVPCVYAGSAAFFAFDKQGEPLWQRGVAKQDLWYRSDRVYSAPIVYNDTIQVLYEHLTTDGTERKAMVSMKAIALATGEISLGTPVLLFHSIAYWSRSDIPWIDPQTVLLRSYEADIDGTRLFKLRVKSR